MYFNHNFIKNKYRSHKKRRKSLNKIFISKAEIKNKNYKNYLKETMKIIKKNGGKGKKLYIIILGRMTEW